MEWNLSDIIETDNVEELTQKVIKSLNSLENDVLELIKSPTIPEFKKIVFTLENIQEKLNRIYGYPSLAVEKNNRDEKNIYLKSKAKSLISIYDDKTRKFFHFIKGLEEGSSLPLNENEAHELFKSIGNLKYKYEYIRKLAHRTLKEKEEEIITKKDLNLLSTIQELRSLIETDQVYIFSHPETKKREKHHNSALLMRNVYSKNEKVRENTYKALFKPYVENIQKYFSIYESVVKDWNQEMLWRGYDSPIQVRNESNDISDKTVQSLIQSVEENTKLFRKFFKIKAKLFGIKKLNRYDIYAPIDGEDNSNYSFSEAKDLILEILKDFDSEFYKNGLSVFEHNHIDSEPLKDKSSGAFCATISPKLKPYILLNYASRKRDVLILAHELGHAIHSIFAEHNFPSIQEAPLTLAETASTLSEMMVFDYLYKRENNITIKRQMLADKITDSYATICRQIYFIKFEIFAHDKIPGGIQLNDFNNAYFNNLKDLFEDSVKVDDIFKYEWAYIPHIVNSPFYCYAYAFGNLLSLSLYKRLKENSKFIRNIKEILRAGGSQNTEILLKNNGINLSDIDFWQNGFDQINSWIEELNSIS